MNAAAIEVLIDKGLSSADILEVARALEKKKDNTAAERQARYRSKRNARNSNGVSPNDIDILTPGSEAKASSPFTTCPQGVDPQHWSDFRKARKRKGAVETPSTYAGVIRDLEKYSDDDWPPGRLVQRSAEMGWGRIVNPKESKYGPAANQGSRNRQALLRAVGDRPDEPF